MSGMLELISGAEVDQHTIAEIRVYERKLTAAWRFDLILKLLQNVCCSAAQTTCLMSESEYCSCFEHTLAKHWPGGLH
jgi:hypothetical protein